jgi:filamentous hemagglutinin family protein
MSGSNQGWALGLGTSLVLGGLVLFGGDYAKAQITPDDTLGNEASVVKPNVDIKGRTSDQIEGGATRGANLFHSFSEFNVGEGQRVYFANPDGIQNILSRVTGTDPSDILGTLGVQGNANLFLLNPNGIIFGPNARLDVSGSFVASTANSLEFGNGEKFSATNPEAPPLLTINVTPGLQYGANQPGGTIANTGNLAVGQDLILAAGNLDLQGQLYAGRNLTLLATDTVQVRDSVANPFIASAGEQLLVQGNQRVDIFALNHPDSGLFSGGNMVLRSASAVGGDAHYWSGGNFRIEQLEGSLGDLESPNDPVIRASGDVSFDSYEGASLHIFAGGSVNIKEGVKITSADVTNGLNETVTLSDRTLLEIKGETHPTLDIRAGVRASEIGTPPIDGSGNFDPIPPFPPPFPGGTPERADIKIGTINNNGGVVFLTNQYKPNGLLGDIVVTETIDTSTSSGNGGLVTIDSRGGLTLTGEINSFSKDFSGNNGNITLIANDDITTGGLTSGVSYVSSFSNGGDIMLLSRQGQIDTTTGALKSYSGSGNGGNINIKAYENINTGPIFSYSLYLTSGNISLTSESGSIYTTSALSFSASGTGGDINLTANNGNITSTQQLYSDSELEGRGGNIDLRANGNIRVNSIRSKSRSSESGRITLTSYNGEINTLGFLDSTSVIGTGGDIKLTANGNITNKKIESHSSFGDSGDITITSLNGGINATGGDLISLAGSLMGSARIGRGGDITLNAKLDIGIRNIDASGGSSGGNITIASGADVSLTQGSLVEVLSDSGGNIGINARNLELAQGSGLRASRIPSQSGLNQSQPGNIDIGVTEAINLADGSFITTVLQPNAVGRGGDITINANSLSATNGSQLATSTLGEGDAGNVTLSANTISFENESGVLTSVEPGAKGNGGEIYIKATSLFMSNGSQLQASTKGEGNAGNVTLEVADRISFTGSKNGFSSGVTSTSELGAVGNSSNITINTRQLDIQDGGAVTVSSAGGGKAGNIGITAENIFLNTEGAISASTLSVFDGGNIILNVDKLLVLRRGSQISTSAGTAQSGGNGGNIIIKAPEGFIIGILHENSDITANAFEGNGGNINIEAQRIFGLQERPKLTDKSDITASSEFGRDGEIGISQLALNPNNGLASLPGEPLPEVIEPKCQIGSRPGSNKFTVIGRGGLPPNPTQTIDNNTVWVDIRSDTPGTENSSSSDGDIKPTRSAPKQIVEAQGWVINDDGKVELVAVAPQATLPQQTPVACDSQSEKVAQN